MRMNLQVMPPIVRARVGCIAANRTRGRRSLPIHPSRRHLFAGVGNRTNRGARDVTIRAQLMYLSRHIAHIPARSFWAFGFLRLSRAYNFGLVFSLVNFRAISAQKMMRTGIALALSLTLFACSTPEPGTLSNNAAFDPYEVQNRRTHNFNKSLDRSLFRPAGKGYQTVIPIPIQSGVSNFSSNLSMPGVAVNSLLQGDLRGVGLAITRFAMNTTIGLAGIIDAADEFGVPDHDTDFGETLYVWGAPEGAYIELPILGPSTERAATGRFVDLFTNPLAYMVGSSDRRWAYAANVASNVSDRGRFSETIDYILYQSADSYAQARLIYVQNRRFELGLETNDDSADPYDDIYTDPYEDPYAE